MWSVLDEVEDPWGRLDAAARNLEPGGVLALAMPNPGSFQFRMTRGRWPHVDAPRRRSPDPGRPARRARPRGRARARRPHGARAQCAVQQPRRLAAASDEAARGRRPGGDRALPRGLDRGRGGPDRALRPARKHLRRGLREARRPVVEVHGDAAPRRVRDRAGPAARRARPFRADLRPRRVRRPGARRGRRAVQHVLQRPSGHAPGHALPGRPERRGEARALHARLDL